MFIVSHSIPVLKRNARASQLSHGNRQQVGIQMKKVLFLVVKKFDCNLYTFNPLLRERQVHVSFQAIRNIKGKRFLPRYFPPFFCFICAVPVNFISMSSPLVMNFQKFK